MTTLKLDGLSEEEFRRSIEMRLRHDLAGAALDRLRGLIEPYAGEGKILPQRFLSVTANDLNLCGWDGLAEALRRLDRPGRPITALSIAFAWPGEDAPGPDDAGQLTPLVETSYFTDEAFPFSQSSREDLLDGYSYYGCSWADDCESKETTLSLGGIDDLHGALAALEARLLANEEPDEEEIRAGSLGSCLLSVLLFQAVGARIARDGLPRPLCILAGSNGVYPYFDAPVIGIPDDVRKAAEAAEEEQTVDRGVPVPRYSSLLVTGIPRAKKRAVLVLEESEEEMAVRISHLRGLHHRDEAAPPPPSVQPEPVSAGDPETTITPAPNGPLMTKKPHGHSWDFRDMLSPLESFGGGDELPPLGSKPPVPDFPFGDNPDDQTEPPEADLPPLPEPEPEPELEEPAPIPRPRFPSQAPAGPGFTLLEPSLQARLDSLVAPTIVPQLRPIEREAEPVDAVEAQQEEPVEAQAAAPDHGPAWPLGIGWLEEDNASSDEVSDFEQDFEPRPSLWARLRAWIGRR